MESKHTGLWILLLIVLVLSAGLYFTWVTYYEHNATDDTQQADVTNQTVCTQDAKLCADGSYVGRSGPNCEFDACPQPTSAISPGSDWKVGYDADTGFGFSYPEFTSTYVTSDTWPPDFQSGEGEYTCDTSATTVEKVIEDTPYCITTSSEGAAGSVYTTYTYKFDYHGGATLLTFTVRKVQCENYDEPEKSECKNIQASFDPDEMAHMMAYSIV